MPEHCPHIVHTSKVYFAHEDPLQGTIVVALGVKDVVTPEKAEQLREELEEMIGFDLRPATPAEIEEHENAPCEEIEREYLN